MNLTPQEENNLNEVGDKMATMLKMRRKTGLDTQGRIRWITEWGTKTGIGLLRTVEDFVSQEVQRLGK